jgi:hypothetical protein
MVPAVLAFTLLAAWLLQSVRARRWYSGDTPPTAADARDS